MRANHNFCGHVHIRYPVTSERSYGREKHLGEYHQKLAIPAGKVKGSGREKGRQAWPDMHLVCWSGPQLLISTILSSA